MPGISCQKVLPPSPSCYAQVLQEQVWRLQTASPSLLTIVSHASTEKNTCASNFTVFTVFVQITWDYGCCGNYNYEFPDFGADKILCNMVQVRAGQGYGVGASIGHGQEVDAECLLKLELDLDDFPKNDARDISPSKHAFQTWSPVLSSVASCLSSPAGTLLSQRLILMGKVDYSKIFCFWQ